jgi:hypothetical protein
MGDWLIVTRDGDARSVDRENLNLVGSEPEEFKALRRCGSNAPAVSAPASISGYEKKTTSPRELVVGDAVTNGGGFSIASQIAQKHR